jgi:hypothetical protein
MLDPRLYPYPQPLGETMTLGDVGTTKKHTLTRQVTEIVFGHANAATVTLSGNVLPGMMIICRDGSGTGTADKKVKLPTGCTFDGTNTVATMNLAAEQLVAIAITPKRFAIIANIGAVALGTS